MTHALLAMHGVSLHRHRMLRQLVLLVRVHARSRRSLRSQRLLWGCIVQGVALRGRDTGSGVGGGQGAGHAIAKPC
jgi:hypothetical protein